MSPHRKTGKEPVRFGTNQVTLASTTVPKLVKRIYGGGSVIIKALTGNTGNVYLGDRIVETGTGYELAPGENVTIEFTPDKDPTEFLDVFGIPATADDKVCFAYVI